MILRLLLFTLLLFPLTTSADVGDNWGFWGDSQTDDNAADSARWIVMIAPTTVSDYWNGGLSASNITAGRIRYESYVNNGDFTWVHFQESGNQDHEGQRTASDFGDSFDAAVASIRTNSPNAVISYETAFSFGREDDVSGYRDWTSYNVELRSRIAALEASGTTVLLADTDANIKALDLVADPADVWCQADTGCEYHYRSLGNLMVALTVWEAVGVPLNELDLTDPEILALNGDDVQAAIDIAYGDSSVASFEVGNGTLEAGTATFQ